MRSVRKVLKCCSLLNQKVGSVMGVRLIILGGIVLTLPFLTSFTTAFPEQHLSAVEGDSALLNCSVDNQGGVERSTLDWSKVGMKGRVHVYKHRKDQVKDQNEEFRGRTTLDHEGLKRGTVTLTLHSVQLSDSGRYDCYIKTLDYHCYVTLNIVPSGQTNMSKGENSSTTESPDEDNQCESGCQSRNFGRTIVLSIVFFFFIIVIVILIIRYCEAMKSKMKSTDEENQLNHQGAPSSSTPEISINQASAPHLVTHTDTRG